MHITINFMYFCRKKYRLLLTYSHMCVNVIITQNLDRVCHLMRILLAQHACAGRGILFTINKILDCHDICPIQTKLLHQDIQNYICTLFIFLKQIGCQDLDTFIHSFISSSVISLTTLLMIILIMIIF